MSLPRRFATPLAIYALTRAFAALVMLLLSDHGWVPAAERPDGYRSYMDPSSPPGYPGVVASWDGQWYWEIADRGYPDSPLGADGQPTQTALAFYPLYPLLVRCVMALTSLPFDVAAAVVSLALGAVAVVVVHLSVSETLGRRAATTCTAMLCCFIASPVLQMAYTEGLALVMVAVTLLLLRRRRYLWAVLPVLLLGLTRNIAIALAPVILLHWGVRLWGDRPEGRERIPHVRLGALLVSPVVATALWPAIVAVLTHRVDGYVVTVQAWPGFSGSILRPPWATALSSGGFGAWAAAIVLLAVAAVLLTRAWPRQWGPELWGWAVAYPAFILFSTSASTSLARYLLLAFPLGLLLAPPTSAPSGGKAQTAVIVLACLVGLAAQVVWLRTCVVSGPYYP